MKWAKGQRPWTIWLFVAMFLGAALYAYVSGLNELGSQQVVYETLIPSFDWNRDWTIVTLSALFTIAFIPVALIFLFAARIARLLVAIFSVVKLIELPQMFAVYADNAAYIDLTYFLHHALILGALICLFLPASSRWFAKKQGIDSATFA